MHKKTTVKDIGEKLDEFIYSSKASVTDYWSDSKHLLEQPHSATKDQGQDQFDWYHSIVDSFDARKPNWLDDESQIEDIAGDEKEFA